MTFLVEEKRKKGEKQPCEFGRIKKNGGRYLWVC